MDVNRRSLSLDRTVRCRTAGRLGSECALLCTRQPLISYRNQTNTLVNHARFVAPVLLATAAAVVSCSGSVESSPGRSAAPGAGESLELIRVTNGFGQLLPYRTAQLDPAGQPTSTIVDLRSVAAITSVGASGGTILQPTSYPSAAILPNGSPGNHFAVAEMSASVDVIDAFQRGLLAGPEGLRATVCDSSGNELVIPGRLFIGGRTIDGNELRRWVEVDDETGDLRALLPAARGFPGVDHAFVGAATLAHPSSIVFIADADGDLETHEMFPTGTLRFQIPEGLLGVRGESLFRQIVATTTVGTDVQAPSVLHRAGVASVTPSNGQQNVDPETAVTVTFTEPIALRALGIDGHPGLAPALLLGAAISGESIGFAYDAAPISPYDLTTIRVDPALSLPGAGENSIGFNVITVETVPSELVDLVAPVPNAGGPDVAITFSTSAGQGLVNAPVAPDTIYIARGGTTAGLSVIDLNGFGQSTGNPAFTAPFPLEGETRFPLNPNFFASTTQPPLVAGTTTVDGGSAGVFTLTRDTNLDDRQTGSPALADTSVMHIGQALDVVLNNAPPPFGCQAGGGSLCSISGLKAVTPNGGTTLSPGFPNVISRVPHPNPPKLALPFACALPSIGGQEPTSVDSQTPNLLIPGDPLGVFPTVPPTGLLAVQQNAEFVGPSHGQTQIAHCSPYGIRQQIGHFLYVLDRVRSEVVALNSNRMTVIDRIPITDATDMTISPDLGVLAVSCQSADLVEIIDIDPASARFHSVVSRVPVGTGPRGLAFEPSNEDLLVCNTGDDTVSIISPASFTVRKTVPALVAEPFELVVLPRMTEFAFRRDVYFAYILGRDGRVALFESGPDGPNGIGFDTVVGLLDPIFLAPKTIQIDPLNLDASAYVVHEGPIDPMTNTPGAIGDGAITRLRMGSALTGPMPIAGLSPSIRHMNFEVIEVASESGGQLSGIPVDIAFDDQVNEGHLRATPGVFGVGAGAPVNGKSPLRGAGSLADPFRAASRPQHLFAAIAGQGLIDVLALASAGAPRVDVDVYRAGVQSIEAAGARALCNYWRQ